MYEKKQKTTINTPRCGEYFNKGEENNCKETNCKNSTYLSNLSNKLLQIIRHDSYI